MAKGKYKKKAEVKERLSDRETLTLWLLEQMIAATVRQEDAAKALALACKHMSRRPHPEEEDHILNQFRLIEQGNTPPELAHARFKGKGGKRKR